MVSPEDIETIDILITQRRNEEASLDKEIKEEPVLKDGKQTDGSCDRTTGSGTDATDATDTQKEHKKRICRKLNKEFIVYVGEERTKMRLVECSDSNSLPETSESDFQILGTASNSNSEESASSSNSEDSDKSGKKSNSEESDKTASNSEDSDKSGSNSDGSNKSAKNSNSEETTKESEVSVEEIEVPPKSFPIYDVDSSNSDKTEDIYKTHMDGSKISLATVSTISTEPCTPKTMVTEQSTTFPYSQSDESIQFLSEEERQDKKESEENNVTGATDEKEDIEDGQQNNGEQVKDSVDKGALSPVENNGEQVKYSVDTEPVSPVETTRAPSPVPVSPV